MHKLESDVNDRLLSELTPEQHEAAERELGPDEQWRELPPISVSLLRKHVSHSPNVAELNERDGIEPDYDNDSHIGGGMRLSGHPGQLPVALPELLIRDPRVQRLLDVSLSQSKEIRRVVEQQKASANALQQNHNRRRREGATNQELALLELELEAVRRESKEEILDEILLLPQRESLLRLSMFNRFRRIGLLALLTDGSLGHEIEVTGSQRNRLFAQSDELQKMVNDRSDSLTDRYHNQLLEALPAKAQQKLRVSLGDPPRDLLRSSPDLILRQLPAEIREATSPTRQ